MTAKAPDLVDVHVGDRIRRRRQMLNQSQHALADQLGVSFQQVQKYEKGANRISASMMARAAQAQGVAPSYYFDGLDLGGGVDLPQEGQDAASWLQSAEAVPLALVMARLPRTMRLAVEKIARGLESVPA